VEKPEGGHKSLPQVFKNLREHIKASLRGVLKSVRQ